MQKFQLASDEESRSRNMSFGELVSSFFFFSEKKGFFFTTYEIRWTSPEKLEFDWVSSQRGE